MPAGVRDAEARSADRPPRTEELEARRRSRLAWSLRNADPQRCLALAGEALAVAERRNDDLERARALLARGYARFRLSTVEGARDDARAALALFEELGDLPGRQRALNTVGIIQGQAGAYGEAFESFLALKALQERQGDRRGLADTFNNIAILHTHLGDFAEAAEHYRRSLELCREASYRKGAIHALVNLGATSLELTKYGEALDLFGSALELCPEEEDPDLHAIVLANVGRCLTRLGRVREALAALDRAMRICRRLERPHSTANVLEELGAAHQELGEHEIAEGYLRRCLEIRMSAGDWKGRSEALRLLGRGFRERGRLDDAVEALQRALALAEEAGAKDDAYKAHADLAATFELAGDPARALESFKAYHAVKERVFNENAEKRTWRLKMQIDLERARHETERYRLRTVVTEKARDEAEAAVRERTRELEEAQLEIVTRLAIAGEYRDDDTGEHTWRVGRNAAAIAREMGWPEEEARVLFAAARLHDIGKIGISDAILLKPGKLTRDEYALVQNHSAIGAGILSGGRSKLLRLAEEVARAHHERWDGGGYPHGLAGDAIPPAARIVAVADVLDALTHVRPYKEAWPVEEALAEIERQAGRQFDPQVVAACLRVFAPGGALSPLDAVVDRPREGRAAPGDAAVERHREGRGRAPAGDAFAPDVRP